MPWYTGAWWGHPHARYRTCLLYTSLPSEYAAWSAPQEDGQEAADENEGEIEDETTEAEDAGEAEEEIYA